MEGHSSARKQRNLSKEAQDNERGNCISIVNCQEDIDNEAEYVANTIRAQMKENSIDDNSNSNQPESISKEKKEQLQYKDIAILYRTNRKGQYFERALIHYGIPYRIRNGKEILSR